MRLPVPPESFKRAMSSVKDKKKLAGSVVEPEPVKKLRLRAVAVSLRGTVVEK